jgi:hypothetical protein
MSVPLCLFLSVSRMFLFLCLSPLYIPLCLPLPLPSISHRSPPPFLTFLSCLIPFVSFPRLSSYVSPLCLFLSVPFCLFFYVSPLCLHSYVLPVSSLCLFPSATPLCLFLSICSPLSLSMRLSYVSSPMSLPSVSSSLSYHLSLPL